MKNKSTLTIAAFAALAFALGNCKKEKETCPGCELIIANSEGYDYKVSFSGWPGSPSSFTMKPGDIKTFTIPPDKSITVKGDFQSPFAHNDFNRNYICEGEGNCGSISVILKE